MKCHYEVLEISLESDDSQIKAAYRRLALKWHPDKNIENSDAAKEKFQLIQQAYEVLSDFRERAWYDRHREQILRSNGSAKSNYEDKSLDVYQYFTASCYKGFGDDVGGFYQIYLNIFHQIATEDLEFMDEEDDFDQIPKFGNSTSDYETVVGPFYGYWQSYSTKKSYSWLCPHNINEIRDRRILREIEKELKKLAQKARKDRNEEVRALVNFVRKRDKRVHQYKIALEQKAKDNRIKQDQKRLEQIRKNRVEADEMSNSTALNVDDYEKMLKLMERTYASSDDDDEDDGNNIGEVVQEPENVNLTGGQEDEEYVDHLYCVACNKSFKNESSYKNHETSKKHINSIEKLIGEMLQEDYDFAGDENEEDEINLEDSDEADTIEVKKSKKSKKKNRVITQIEPEPEQENIEDVPVDECQDEKIEQKEKPRKTAKLKRAKKNAPSTNPIQAATSSANPKPEADREPVHSCATCNFCFESKNKLFNHIKKTNHAVFIPKESCITTATTKKSKHRK